MAKNVIALYNDYQEAQSAVHRLEQAGFSHENISVISSGTRAHPGRATRSPVLVGALAGGLIGLVTGLAALAIPQVAAYLWYGPLVTLLVGAGLGVLIGRWLRQDPSPTAAESEAADDGYYATRFAGDEIVLEGVQRGGTVVMAYVNEQDADRAAEALGQQAVEINHRSAAMLAQQSAGQPQHAAQETQRFARASRTQGARRPTAPMGAFPRRSSTVPLDVVQGQSEAVPGKSAYAYDRRGAEMSRYRDEGPDRPPLPEALDPLHDPTEPLDES